MQRLPRWRMQKVQRLTTWFLERSVGRQARREIQCRRVKEWRVSKRIGITRKLIWCQLSYNWRRVLVQPKTMHQCLAGGSGRKRQRTSSQSRTGSRGAEYNVWRWVVGSLLLQEVCGSCQGSAVSVERRKKRSDGWDSALAGV